MIQREKKKRKLMGMKGFEGEMDEGKGLKGKHHRK